MAKHIIIGAGLGGLYTASRLINKGIFSNDITIIDPRANKYTRPGHLSHELFSLVQHKTGINTDNHSPAHHIKELERQMYTQLIAKGVQFIQESFVRLQGETESQVKAVVTENEDGSQKGYPADFVFDCTGKEAYVAQAVNLYQQERGLPLAFNSSLLTGINPIPDHLIAHVFIPGNHQLRDFINLDMKKNSKVVPKHYMNGSPQKNIAARKELKALGWPYEAFPTFYTYPQAGTQKVCLYMETPPDLTIEQHSAWIKLLLCIYSNGSINSYTELNPSKKYEKKPRIVGFKINHYLLNKVILETADLPTILIGFDALKGSDYRRANGVTSGIKCCELMLKHIIIRNGSIQSIDVDAIEQVIFKYINDTHKTSLDLSSRQKAIENGYDYFSKIYAEAAKGLPQSEQVKKQKYQSIASELAYQSGLNQFYALENRNKSAIASIEVLNKCLASLLIANKNMPANQTQAHYDINNKLQSIINMLRLEIAALSINETLENNNMSYTQLITLFENIKENFKQLEGSFAKRVVQHKSEDILEWLKQREASAPKNHTKLELNSAMLLPLLFSGLPRNTPTRSNLPFFAPPLQIPSPEIY